MASRPSPRPLQPVDQGSTGAGDLLTPPPRTAYALRNGGAAPAAVLALTASPSGRGADAAVRCGPPPPSALPACAPDAGAAPAVVARQLAGGQSTTLSAPRAAVAIGRATLAPRAALAFDAAAGPALLHVEAGTVALETSDEAATEELGAGDGALLRLGAAATLRNAGGGPLVALVVTILPADAAPAP